jgi:hypothetical protein
MQRLLWFGLFSLLGISGLFAARTVAGVTVIKRGVPDAIAADAADNHDLPLAKGDRLSSPFLDGALPKTVVGTVKIAPTETPQQSEAPKDAIASWHWHEGSKIVRRRTTVQTPAADKRVTERR